METTDEAFSSHFGVLEERGHSDHHTVNRDGAVHFSSNLSAVLFHLMSLAVYPSAFIALRSLFASEYRSHRTISLLKVRHH